MKVTKANLLASAALVLAVLGAGAILKGQGAQTKLNAAAQQEPQPGQYSGLVSCASASCHGSEKPRDRFDVKQNEYFTWVKFDKHAKAYAALGNPQSQIIARNMRLKTKAQETPICLDCHALNVAKSARAKPLDVAEGVSCEACHGAASGWLSRHAENGWSHEQSVKGGMTDLRNPAVRAQTCLGCHLGTADKNVDHELIAAGHPDLRFELDNYADRMPRHWIAFAERKNRRGREETEGARAWAAGQAVAFREGLLRLARHARSAKWPEFAELDCYACHHSLQDTSWRQATAPKAGLGLPKWSPARFAMLRHVAAVFAPGELAKIEGASQELSAAMLKSIHTGEVIAVAATRLAEVMQPVIAKVGQARVDAGAARRFVDLIVKDLPKLLETDIRSAEQAVMAVNTLVSDVARNNPALDKKELSRAIDNLYRDVESPEGFEPQIFSKHMTELQRLLERRGGKNQ